MASKLNMQICLPNSRRVPDVSQIRTEVKDREQDAANLANQFRSPSLDRGSCWSMCLEISFASICVHGQFGSQYICSHFKRLQL